MITVATIATYAIGWLFGVPALLPFLNAAPAWWLMARALRVGQVNRAIAIMLIWAATLAVCATAMAAFGWTRRGGGELFLQADYKTQMISWVQTGVGPESDPAAFVPRQLAYAAVFTAAAVATGGVLAMPMGAVLMNSMGDYVGTLAARGAHPLPLAVLGWHPWAILRIIGFVILGVVLSGVLLSRVWTFEYSLSAQTRWLTIGVALLAVDIAVKWMLAPAWSPLLRGLAGW
ncbi:MAG TPA: hypothetical protein VFV98_16610 [Vicinamibacterales bacterium]|nr:hypothetical protein [Vicinamibacterales bacterium]